MSHDCSHHSAKGVSESRLRLSSVVTFLFVIVELIGGWKAHSLGLISDGVHNFTDGFSLVLSWYALVVARRPATSRNTFGYHRAGIIVALVNAITLILSSLYIMLEAGLRVIHPEPVETTPMIIVALIAVVVNTLIAAWLHQGSEHDINVRSAYIHMVGDALFSLGVALAGLIIRWTGWVYADPLIAFLIGGYIGYASFGIIRETTHILLEGAPRGLNMDQMLSAMQAMPGVENIHHLHVWTIGDGMHALSCHLRVGEMTLSNRAEIVRDLKAMLSIDYSVSHSTIETECGECGMTTLYCAIESPDICHDHVH